jgi:hypothetical protein
VYGAGANPGTRIQVFDESESIVWQGLTNTKGFYETSTRYDGILACPGTYKVVAFKTGCSFSTTTKTTTFEVGETSEDGWYKRVDFRSNCSSEKTGRILGHVYGTDVNPGITVTILDNNGVFVWKGETDRSGYFDTSTPGEECILITPGTYTVTPSKQGCTFTNPTETVTFGENDNCENGEYKRVDFRADCSPINKGRIMGYVYGSDSNPGTTISIFDSNDILVWRGETNIHGYYETSAYGSVCILTCPGAYKVVPSKPGCSFTYTNKIVTFLEGDCCEVGEYKRVDFQANCSLPKTARIIGNITGSGGNPGTTVRVYDSKGVQVWIGKSDSSGYYETSALDSPGILACPGSYMVIPSKTGCTFSPTTQLVKFLETDSCEDGQYMKVDFTSDCSPKESGRIAGRVYGSESNPDTLITITDSTGAEVWSGLTDVNGYYETSVYGQKGILACPGTYEITPSKNGCSFTNQKETVTFTSTDCSENGEYMRVDFQANCSLPQTARIIGYITGTEGNPITTVRVYDSNGIQVWIGQTDSYGYYETSDAGNDCILKCPGTYKIVPSRTGCTFTETDETITFSENDSCENNHYKRVDFKSNCASTKTARIAGHVYGSDANPGVTITVTNSAGTKVWQGQTNSNGHYETSSIYGDCILSCPGTYKVVPSKTGYTFSHESETVTFNDGSCCEDGYYMRIDFNAYSVNSSDKARIKGYVYGSGCNPGTTISIYNSNGTKVWSGQTNSDGYYESSTASECILPCPGTYRIVPTKTNYIFSYGSETVTFYDGDCCSDNRYMRVDFRGYYSPYRSIQSPSDNTSQFVYGTIKELYLSDDTRYLISQYTRKK